MFLMQVMNWGGFMMVPISLNYLPYSSAVFCKNVCNTKNNVCNMGLYVINRGCFMMISIS